MSFYSVPGTDRKTCDGNSGLVPLWGSPNPSCLVISLQEYKHPRRQVHLLTNLRCQNYSLPHQPGAFVPLANSFSCSRALFNKTVGGDWLFSKTMQQHLSCPCSQPVQSHMHLAGESCWCVQCLTSSCSSSRCLGKGTMETAEKNPFLGAALL